MADEPIDTDLLLAAVSGDHESLQQLLFLVCPLLTRHLRSQCPSELAEKIEVDDVLQDTLLTAVKGFPHFRGQSMGEFCLWLRTIAQHRLLDRVRYAKTQKRRGSALSLVSPDVATSSVIQLVSTLFDTQDTPSRSYARREEIDAIRVAIAHLPDDQRQAMVLRYFEGMSTHETAEVMNRSPDAVRGLVNRAMASLRKLLGKSSRWFGWK